MTEKESNEYKEPSGPSDGHFLFSDRQLEVAKWRWAFIRLDRNYQKDFRQWHGTSRDVVFAARWWLRELIDPKLTFDDICKEYEAPKYADVSESKKESWVLEQGGGGGGQSHCQRQ